MSHVKSVHKVGPIPVAIRYYKCVRCSFSSTTEGTLEKHVRHAHKQVGLNNAAQKVSLVPVQSKMLQNHIKIAHREIKDTPSTSLEGSPNKRVKVIEVGSNDEASKKGMYRVLKSGVLKLKAEHVPTPKSYECQYCPHKTMAKDNHLAHVRSNHEGFGCQECGQCFCIEYQLKAHNAAYHNHADKYRCNSSVEEKHEIGASTLLRRVKCKYSTTGKKELQEHVFRVHGSATIRYCGQCFFAATVVAAKAAPPSESDTASADGIIVKHMVEAHGSVEVKKTPEPFKCQQCPYEAISKHSLQGHMRSNHEGFTCQECGHSFGLENQLKTHNSAYHNHADKYRCESTVEVKHEIGASTLVKRVKCEYSTTVTEDFQVRLTA